MYIVGHSLSVVDSGVLKPKELDGNAVVATMACDIIDNHSWAYPRAFDWPGNSPNKKFMQVHVIGDWFVHFGDKAAEQRREGWAYRVMSPIAERFDEFFAEAYRQGLRASAVPNDSVRGFSHTIAEYVVDYQLARAGKFDPYFAAAKDAIGSIYAVDGDRQGSRTWLRRLVEDETMPFDPVRTERQVRSFAHRASLCENPEEFIAYAVIDKFLLSYTPRAVRYVLDFVSRALDEVGAREVSRHYEDCCDFIRRSL
jgi:hypothetical protein